MAKPVVTQERVFEVAQQLRDRGQDPTILSVQAAIGGGSYSTVKRYLDVWKEQDPRQRRSQVTLPEAAVDRLMSLGREFWGMLEDQAARETEQIRVQAQAETDAMRQQLEQAEQAIAKLEQDHQQLEQHAAERQAALQTLQTEHQGLRERASAAEAKIGQLEARLADQKSELARALTQLDTERQATAAAQSEAKGAAVESARLQGELDALRKK